MAAQALTIVGGVVGAFFGMPQLGALAGSLIGNALFPQKLPDGPRLSDLKFTTSTNGKMLPKIFGTIRTAGNVIASTPKIETKHSAGKGSSGSKTTYSYYQSFAIAICEGPITGISQIFANGICIYNNSTGTDPQTVIASSGLASAVRIYTGTSTQLPDPWIQSYYGINETSAYRGTAYAVFENFQLADFGNSLPNLEFIVVNDGSLTFNQEPLYPTINSTFPNSVENISTFVPMSNSYIYGYYFDTQTYGLQNVVLNVYKILQSGQKLNYSISNLTSSSPLAFTFSGLTKSDDGSTFITQEISTTNFTAYNLFPNGSLNDISNYIGFGTQNLSIGKDPYAYVKKNNNSCVILKQPNTTNYYLNIISTETINILLSNTNNVYDIDISDNYIYVLIGTSIKKYDFQGNLISTLYTRTATQTNYPYLYVVSDTLIYTFDEINANWGIYEVSTGTANLILNCGATLKIGSNGQMYTDGQSFYIYNYSSGIGAFNNNLSFYLFYETISNNPPLLSKVLTNLCTLVNLPQINLDFTHFNDQTLPSGGGYFLSKVDTIRNAIQVLCDSFQFDVVESDGVLKFVSRGSSNYTTIPINDLAAHTYGQKVPDNVSVTRKQELDLFKQINITFLDPSGNYQANTVYSLRETTSSLNINNLEIPLAVDSNTARKIADIMLYENWNNRNLIKINLSYKYLYLEPTDLILIQKDQNYFLARITDITYQNGILEVSCLSENIKIYQQSTVAPQILGVPLTVQAQTPTDLQLLDIPLLRDQDDGVGFYVAAGGYLPGWQGCVIYKSNDSGLTYSQLTNAITNESIIGYTQNALGNFLSGNIFDETNVLTVFINNSSLSLSSQTEINVLNGANVALVGNELIQFKNAVQIQSNIWKLSGLIRGKQGTDWAMSSHTINERFILLNTSSINILQSPSSEYDLLRYYKAPSKNESLTDAEAISFTNTDIAQECLSPVQIGGGRDSSGNITINWIRRGRINNSWQNYIDIPLGETSENYQIDILNSTNQVLRTISTTTNTASYTASQQTTDFGSVQSSVKINIYQISSVRGRGYQGSATI